MGMGIGINDEKTDEGRLKGRQEPVACSVWFTSTGRLLPKMMKYKEADGEIVVISDIHVESSDRKNYCGIPVLSFECSAAAGNTVVWFRLLYYVERQRWCVIWRENL